MWGAHWTMNAEKRGIPSVYVVDEPFEADVQITCDKEGMPDLRRVIIPHPCRDISDEQFAQILPQLIDGLTKPSPPIYSDIEIADKKKDSRIALQGTLQEVNDFFYTSGWTDGLPIIPPTEEAVQHMLSGTSHRPREIVTDGMLPESLTATVEKVAIVGVMAGCEPKYMPVLLGIVDAFANDLFSSSVRSTTSFANAVIVSGPMAKEIGMNSGINAMGSGSGNKANATIGRFLRLAIICLGGSRSGINDMSSQGHPAKFSFAFTENIERSPWEPFHVSLGFKAAESTVTILNGGWSHHSPLGRASLDQMAADMVTYELPTGALVIMDPISAKQLADKGFTKEKAETYLWSHATRTIEEFKSDFFYEMFIEPALRGKPWYGSRQFWPQEYLTMPPENVVPVFPHHEIRIIVVGGGTNPFTQLWQLARPSSVVIDKWR